MIHVTRAVILVSVSFVGLYLFQFSKSEEKVLYPSSCRPVIDSVFSQNLNQDISSFIIENYDQKSPMQGLLESVQEKFSAIRSVSVSLENSAALSISIKGHRPYILINDNLVATESGAILPLGNFADRSLRGLQRFDCSDQSVSDTLKSNALTFFKSIPDPFFDLYSVRWESDDAIWFNHKEQKYSALVSFDWDMNIEDVYLCQKIQEAAVARQNEKRRKRKKRDVRWVCDLRFKGQVVTYPSLQ